MAQLVRYQAEWQRYVAELLGTFVLVFAGCTAIVGATSRVGAPVLLVAAFAFGIAEWDGILIYFIAPPLGAVAAWAVHTSVVKGLVPPPEAAVAEVLEEPPPTPAS